MTVSFTKMHDSFTPASTGWNDYDIYTNKNVPKGAVAIIQCLNSQDAASATIGIRKDGSALDRYLVVHESEGGGSNGYVTNVTVDASTGLIEVYCDTTTGVTFKILGYWQGVTFTERFDQMEPANQATWTDTDLSGYGVGANNVCLFTMAQTGTAYFCDMGVRANGSALTRYIRVHESEPSGVCAYSNYVKADASSVIELYHQYTSSPDRYSYLMGYFATDIDYQELWQALDVSNNTTWETHDLTSYLDQDGRVVSVCMFNTATGATNVLGARGGDDTDDAYYTEHESESYGISGSLFVVQSNSSGEIDLYAGDAASENTYLTGYFKFTAAPTLKEVTDSLSASDASPLNNKTLPITDIIGLAVGNGLFDPEIFDPDLFDTAPIGEFINVIVNQVEAVLKEVTDVLAASDVLLANKSLVFSDYVKIIDLPTPSNCILYLPFDESEGSVARDYSGYGNNGAVSGATVTTGKFGNARSFDGTDDYINCGHVTSYLTSDFTVAAWIKTSTIRADGMMIFSNRKWTLGSTAIGVQIQVATGNIAIYFCDGSGTRLAYNPLSPVANGEWHLVIVTFDRDGYLRIYVDTTLKGSPYDISSQQGNIDSGFNTFIGATPIIDESFSGLIDDVRLYNRALTQTEITALYVTQLVHKTLPITDTITTADTILLELIIKTVADAIGASEIIFAGKSVIVTDATTVSDVSKIDKHLIVLENCSLTDLLTRDKLTYIAEQVGASDTLLLDKFVMLTESVFLAELIVRDRNIRRVYVIGRKSGGSVRGTRKYPTLKGEK